MISKKLLEQMDPKTRDMIEIFQMVFNENELNLITVVFGAEKLAIFMKLATMLCPDSGRIAGLSFIATILQSMKDGGTMGLFFAEANSFKPTVTSNSVN